MPALRKRIFNEGPSNLRAPVAIDVTATPWDVRKVDGIFTANTLHIMHWPQVEAFFAGLPAVAKPGAVLAIYGPFRYGGTYTSGSNESFDAMLRARDPGLRHPRLRGGGRARARRGIHARRRPPDAGEQPDAGLAPRARCLRAPASAPSARGRRSAPASPPRPRSPTASTAGGRRRGRSAARRAGLGEVAHPPLQRREPDAEHDPEMPNSTSVHRIQPVRSSGKPPCIAAKTPLAMMTRTPGIVNSRSLRSTPSIACAMRRASPVRRACLCQNRPVTMLPMNRITARTWTSFSQRYIARSTPRRRELSPRRCRARSRRRGAGSSRRRSTSARCCRAG